MLDKKGKIVIEFTNATLCNITFEGYITHSCFDAIRVILPRAWQAEHAKLAKQERDRVEKLREEEKAKRELEKEIKEKTEKEKGETPKEIVGKV